jgi:hypothetical protein
MKTALLIVATPLITVLFAHGYFSILQRAGYGDDDFDRRVLAWILAVGSVILLWMLFL